MSPRAESTLETGGITLKPDLFLAKFGKATFLGYGRSKGSFVRSAKVWGAFLRGLFTQSKEQLSIKDISYLI